MGTPPGARDDTPDCRRRICVYGTGAGETLGRALRKQFDGVTFLSSLTPSPPYNTDLAIGIFHASEIRQSQEFHRWARQIGAPAMWLDTGAAAVSIGPVSLPGRPGCGYCACVRLLAASMNRDPADPIDSARLTESVVTIVHEIENVFRVGAGESALINHVLILDPETLEPSLHKFIPLPQCEICGGCEVIDEIEGTAGVKVSPAESPEEIFTALEGWVDQRIGVISNLFLEPSAVELPLTCVAAPPYLMKPNGKLHQFALGWGKGLTVSGAMLSAVGEAIERYSASLPRRIVWSRPADLDDDFLDPRAGSLYSEAQYARDGFPFVRFDPDITHPWVEGRWLHNNAPVWVAALDVFLSIEIGREQLFDQGTSNGLAAAFDLEEASLRAILELVERDALMTCWLTGTPGQRIDLDEDLDPSLRQVLAEVERLGAHTEIYSLPTGACGTTVLCLALGDGLEYPGVTFGLGADLDPALAMKQAILELGQTGPYLRRMMRSQQLVASAAESVREMLDHAAYYFPRERAKAFDRLRSNESPVKLSELRSANERSLTQCASELAAASVRVALVDVTAADVATGPFRVVRAVSPDLQPISYGYGLNREPTARIKKTKLDPNVPPISPIW